MRKPSVFFAKKITPQKIGKKTADVNVNFHNFEETYPKGMG